MPFPWSYQLFSILCLFSLFGHFEQDGNSLALYGIGLVIEMQFPALREFGTSGKPIWGTCAGLIFLADKAVGKYVASA
jgi:hypothetical protein